MESKNLIFLTLVLLTSYVKASKDDIWDISSLSMGNFSNPKIKEIKIGFSKIIDKIKDLNITGISNFKNCQQFYGIGKDLLEIQEILTDLQIPQEHTIYKRNIKNLIIFYDMLWNKMIKLRKSKVNFENICSANAVITLIIDHKYQEAESILQFIKHDLVISKIVHNIYDRNEENLKLLLDFTESLSCMSLSTLMIKSILNELESQDHLNLLQTVDLIRLLESQVLRQDNFNVKQHSNAKSLHQKFMIHLKNFSTNIMESDMLDSPFKPAINIADFLPAIYKLNEKLANEIIFEVIDRVYGKTTSKEIMEYILSKLEISQRIHTIMYMYKKMKTLNDLDTGILKLAQYIFDVITNKSIKNNSNTKKSFELLTSIWLALPPSVVNLCSFKNVCLWNIGSLKFLYASADNYHLKTNFTNVFTVSNGDSTPQGLWYIHNKLGSDNFYFAFKEHASASRFHQNNNTNNWWKLEIVGKYVRLKNTISSTLCATSSAVDRNRYVPIPKSHTKSNDSLCLWEMKAGE